MMRVAFVSTVLNYPFGGSDTLWSHAADAALARGDDVCIAIGALAAKHERVQALVARGAHVVLRAAPTPRTLALRAWQRLGGRARDDDTVKALLSFRPDRVVVSCGGTYDLTLEPALMRWLDETKTPLRIIANWQQENPSLSAGDREIIARVFSEAEALFFVSTRNLAATRRHLLSDLPRAVVVHNPLRCGDGALPWPHTSTWRLATVGRLEHVKGIALLLHALADALGHDAHWHLDVFGRGPDESYLRSTADALKLTNRVSFKGHVAALSEIWAHNHILVSPAIDEGVPMTIPEAMLCGRPAIATAVGGAEEWITDGHTGFLCPAPTLPLLTECLRSAWARREAWQEIGQHASVAARQQYRPNDYLRISA